MPELSWLKNSPVEGSYSKRSFTREGRGEGVGGGLKTSVIQGGSSVYVQSLTQILIFMEIWLVSMCSI